MKAANTSIGYGQSRRDIGQRSVGPIEMNWLSTDRILFSKEIIQGAGEKHSGHTSPVD